MRDARIRLQDILFAIEQIEKYRARGRAAFDGDELIQVWMVHHLQIIGEATAQLGRSFHEAYPYAPWAQIVAMRNILVHQYSGVDLMKSGMQSNTIFRRCVRRWSDCCRC